MGKFEHYSAEFLNNRKQSYLSLWQVHLKANSLL